MSIDTDQLQTMLSMFQRPARGISGFCYLCLRSAKKLKSHLSRHLEQIALFALPRVNEAAEMDSQRMIVGSGDEDSRESGSEDSSSELTSQSGNSHLNDEPEMTHDGPDIDDALEETVVPDDINTSWDNITQNFSEPFQLDVESEFQLIITL